MANPRKQNMADLDETHDMHLTSWVIGANLESADFPIQNLPFGMYRRRGDGGPMRACTAIGDRVLDLAAVDAACEHSLNALAQEGRSRWRDLRLRLSRLLSDEAQRGRAERFLVALADVELGLPVQPANYTDFFTSYYHAYNAGKLFRPDAPLTPNFKWMPIAYHGSASSIVASGTDVRRPCGQLFPAGATEPVFAATQFLDFETELGVVLGPGTCLGETVSMATAEDHIFGLVLLNDWSARDVQAWEYQPLGPFLAKSFATTVSPWIVTLEALAPFRAPAFARFAGDPTPLPHLQSIANEAAGHLDIDVEARLAPAGGVEEHLSGANYASSYWTPAQLVVHQASNGCPLVAGDILGTGTISGAEAHEAGSLLELGKMGSSPVCLQQGEQRVALQDGDALTLTASCSREGFRRIGFGRAEGAILPALTPP